MSNEHRISIDLWAAKAWGRIPAQDRTIETWGVSTNGKEDAKERAYESLNNINSGATKHAAGIARIMYLKDGDWIRVDTDG